MKVKVLAPMPMVPGDEFAINVHPMGDGMDFELNVNTGHSLHQYTVASSDLPRPFHTSEFHSITIATANKAANITYVNLISGCSE
jgi:hypothetical protein